MEDVRRRRLADNESAFREINERIGERVERWHELDQTFHQIVCECSDAEFVERIAVTPSEHRMVRRREDSFLIARGHDDPHVERVVYRHDRYWIAEKHSDLVA